MACLFHTAHLNQINGIPVTSELSAINFAPLHLATNEEIESALQREDLDFLVDNFLIKYQYEPHSFPNWFLFSLSRLVDSDTWLNNYLLDATTLLWRKPAIRTFLEEKFDSFKKQNPAQRAFLIGLAQRLLTEQNFISFLRKNVGSERSDFVLAAWVSAVTENDYSVAAQSELVGLLLEKRHDQLYPKQFTALAHFIKKQKLWATAKFSPYVLFTSSLGTQALFDFLQRRPQPFNQPELQRILCEEHKNNSAFIWFALHQNQVEIPDVFPQLCYSLEKNDFFDEACWQKVKIFLQEQGETILPATSVSYRKKMFQSASTGDNNPYALLRFLDLVDGQLTEDEQQHLNRCEEWEIGSQKEERQRVYFLVRGIQFEKNGDLETAKAFYQYSFNDYFKNDRSLEQLSVFPPGLKQELLAYSLQKIEEIQNKAPQEATNYRVVNNIFSHLAVLAPAQAAPILVSFFENLPPEKKDALGEFIRKQEEGGGVNCSSLATQVANQKIKEEVVPPPEPNSFAWLRFLADATSGKELSPFETTVADYATTDYILQNEHRLFTSLVFLLNHGRTPESSRSVQKIQRYLNTTENAQTSMSLKRSHYTAAALFARRQHLKK